MLLPRKKIWIWLRMMSKKMILILMIYPINWKLLKSLLAPITSTTDMWVSFLTKKINWKKPKPKYCQLLSALKLSIHQLMARSTTWFNRKMILKKKKRRDIERVLKPSSSKKMKNIEFFWLRLNRNMHWDVTTEMKQLSMRRELNSFLKSSLSLGNMTRQSTTHLMLLGLKKLKCKTRLSSQRRRCTKSMNID